MKMKLTDILVCPHCHKSEGELVMDYMPITPIEIRPLSKCDCGWCNKFFTVQKTVDGDVEILPINN